MNAEPDRLLFPADVACLHDDVAASLFLHAFADACDRAREAGCDDVPHPGAGGDWADIVPSTFPPRFVLAAGRALQRVDIRTLSYGRAAWQRLSGCDGDRFAHVLACVLLGHGVGFSDDVRTSAVNTAQDRADVDTVERLRRALPRIGESCDVHAEWCPETGQCI